LKSFDKPKTVSLYRRPPKNWPYKRLAVVVAVAVAIGVIIGGGLYWWGKRELTEHFDILILHGTVIDGTGAERRNEAVGIREGKIVAVEHPSFAEADQIIDAEGLIVAPGFIDVHTHIEGNLRWAQKENALTAPNFLSQGVTTIITGNCGTSANSLSQLFGRLRSKGTAINVGSLVGHNTIRRQVLGEVSRDPSEAELKNMCELVRLAMMDGALGLSTGLEYAPGIFSSRREVEALAAVAAQYHGLYATHMRDEGNDVLKSLDEAIQVGRRAKIPVEISHLKSRGRTNWGRSHLIIKMLERAQAEGIQVRCDAYPYTASSTSLEILIPKRAREGGSSKLRERLRDPAEKRRIVEEILSQMRSEGWQDFAFARVAYCESAPEYNGLTIPEIAGLLNKSAGSNGSGRAMQNNPDGLYQVRLVNDKKSSPKQKERSAANKTAKKTPAKAVAPKQNEKKLNEKNKLANQKTRPGKDIAKEKATVNPNQQARPLSLESQAEAICHIASKGGAQMIYENMSEDDVENILRLPYCMLGSDSGIRQTSEGKPHPRGYGSASRLLSLYALDRNLFSLEEAIRKMTSLPAETFGIAGRGKLAVGYWADVVVFDPATLKDRATYERPLQAPDGIVYVLVNGKISLDHGQAVAVSSGQVIKREF
jgi:N-acyl-D-aspartate/D-glutamate deacylase